MAAGKIVLVTGGARSGKSEVAEKLAAAASGQVVYLATAGVYDAEMVARVQKHKARRPHNWTTVEETRRVAEVLADVPVRACVLVDCLTLWITNLLLDESVPFSNATPAEKEDYILGETRRLLATARHRELVLVVVSNQVGCGVVPDNPLARQFRDVAGRVNQQVAAEADQVYLVTAGIPVEIKALAASMGREG